MQLNTFKKILAAALVSASMVAHAAPAEIPQQSQPVMDLTGTLSPDTLTSLNTRAADFKAHTGVQMSVILAATMNGETLDAYSERVAREWHLGENGAKSVLLTVAFTEHGVRLLATRNLSEHLDVNRTNDIISNVLVPQFRQGHIPQGISGAIDAVEADLNGPAVAVSSGQKMTAQDMAAYAGGNSLFRLLTRDSLALGLMFGALVLGGALLVVSRIRSDRALRRSVLRAHAEKAGQQRTGERAQPQSALDKVVLGKPAGLTSTVAKNRLATLRDNAVKSDVRGQATQAVANPAAGTVVNPADVSTEPVQE